MSQGNVFLSHSYDHIGPYVYVADASNKVTHEVQADALLRLFRESEEKDRLIQQLSDSLTRERAKIRRLMAALADEITKD